MADRPVTHARRDRWGETAAVGNPAQWWSPRSTTDVISDIETGAHTYHVPWHTGRTEIRVVSGANGKYLRTDRDYTARNNLDELPAI